MSDSDKNIDTSGDSRPRIDFGARLQKGRTSQNYSIEDVSEHLKIPVPTLKALEASDIESLPAH